MSLEGPDSIDFLGNLAVRALQPELTVQPRLPSRFEPIPHVGGPGPNLAQFEEKVENVGTEPGPVAFRPSAEAATLTPEESPNVTNPATSEPASERKRPLANEARATEPDTRDPRDSDSSPLSAILSSVRNPARPAPTFDSQARFATPDTFVRTPEEAEPTTPVTPAASVSQEQKVVPARVISGTVASQPPQRVEPAGPRPGVVGEEAPQSPRLSSATPGRRGPSRDRFSGSNGRESATGTDYLASLASKAAPIQRTSSPGRTEGSNEKTSPIASKREPIDPLASGREQIPLQRHAQGDRASTTVPHQSHFALRPLPTAVLATVVPERRETPTPTIHVTIGRVEVRAVTTPAGTKPAVSKPKKPISLNQYLRERDRGA
jgi:hypothetical protein